MLALGSSCLQEVWTGEAAEETEAGSVWGRSTTAGELVHCGELFTVSHTVVSLLHALTAAALYPLPSTEELPHNQVFMFPLPSLPTLQLSTHLVKPFSGELIAVFKRFLMFPLPSLPTLQLSTLYRSATSSTWLNHSVVSLLLSLNGF